MSAARPKVVFVTSKLPFPLTDGLSIRQFHLLRAYARVADLALVFFHEDPSRVDGLDALRSYCTSFHPVSAQSIVLRRSALLPLWRRRWEQAATFTPSLPLMFTSSEMQRVVATVAGQADLVHVSRLFMVPNVEPILAQRSTSRFVLDLDDVETVVAARARRLTLAPSWQRRLFDSLDVIRLARYQARALRRFDRVFVCSVPDRERFREASVTVVPNGATIPKEPLPDASDRRTILYLGLLSYEPNIDGLLVFVREVLPLIEKVLPDVRLLVVGRAPSPEVLSLHDGDRIVVAGDVPAVEPYYRRAALSVVTLRMGGGTRLRILESFALGRPVVSTTIGCEGLDVESGKHLFIADEPEEFAARCVEVLTKPALASQFVASARELVEATYDWTLIEEHVARVAIELLTAARIPEIGNALSPPA